MSKNALNPPQEEMAAFSEMVKEIPRKSHVRCDLVNDFVLPSDWEFKHRINPNFHLAYVRNGEGRYILSDRPEPMERGKIICVSPGYRHDREFNANKRPHLSLIRFSLMRNEPLRPADILRPFAFAHIPTDRTQFQTLFDRLSKLGGNGGAVQTLRGILITQILLELQSDMESSVAAGTMDPRVERAIAYMKTYLHRQISIAELAREASLSRDYFRTLFRRQTGQNPHDYWIELKIQKAKELLMETDDKVKDIAYTLGYCDPFAFSKQFKAVTGRAPSEFKLR